MSAAPAIQPDPTYQAAGDKGTGSQPSCPAVGANGTKFQAVGMSMGLMMPPWMPMMMPPWMFGMMAGKPGAPLPSMPMLMPMPGMIGGTGRQQGAVKSGAAQQAASAAPPPAAASGAAGEDAAEDDLPLTPDEEVVVEPEELEVFEKVAALEREKQHIKQQERASSPSGSCYSTFQGGGSTPCSPMSAMQPMPFPPPLGCFPFPPGFPCLPMPMPMMPGCMPAPAQGPQQQHHWQQQAQQHWQPQQQPQQHWQPQEQQVPQEPDSAPVPWSSFAADDDGDDLDKDLQQIIMLPEDCSQPSTSPAPSGCADPTPAGAAADPGAAMGPAAAAKARSSSLKRIGSTASAHSSAEALNAAAAAAAGAGQSPDSGSKAKRVLRIRSIKGASGNSNNKPSLKGPSTAKRTSSSQQQTGASAPGVIKGGVQKVTINTSRANSNSNKKAGSTPSKAPAARSKPQPAVELQQQLQYEEPSLSLLGDLDSSLSGGDALTGGVMPADDYWDTFMQEASDDGWDSLLGRNDMDFISAGL